MDTTTLFTIALIGVLIYRRARRLVGFQKFKPNWLMFRIVMLSGVALVKLALAWLSPWALVGDVLGAVGGAALARQAIRHVAFEKRDTGWFYRTNPWIGAGVLVLLLVRLATRGSWALGGPTPPVSGALDGLTSAFFFAFVVYTVGFSAFVWHRLQADEAALKS